MAKKQESALTTTTQVTPQVAKKFMKKVQEQIVNQYAGDVAHMIQDIQQLEKALATLKKWYGEVEKGNFEYVKTYNKKRSLIAQIEDGDLE